jgi:selenocysteine lyase/cysteine desulfurase
MRLSETNVDQIRSGFPMLARHMNGQQLVYLDSASTSQKPRPMLDAWQSFYFQTYAKPDELHDLNKLWAESAPN